MKRFTFNPRLGVMVESPIGEWVMHAEAKHRVELARFQGICRQVKGPAPESREPLPVAFLPLDAPGDGVDIDRVHRRAAAVVAA